MNKSNPVVHFEMPAKNKDRVAKFYSEAFGWNMNKMGQNMGEYVLAQTAETDEHNMVKRPGAINGGFFEYKDEPLYKVPHLVISVDSIEEAMEKVKQQGGKISGEVMDIPGIGKYVSFYDTEDNIVGMLQPVMSQ